MGRRFALLCFWFDSNVMVLNEGYKVRGYWVEDEYFWRALQRWCFGVLKSSCSGFIDRMKQMPLPCTPAIVPVYLVICRLACINFTLSFRS